MMKAAELFFGSLCPPLADHIWQSTVFALTAGLTTLFFRSNPAKYRFYLWLAASVKFLLPMAFLVRAGQILGSRRAVASRPDFTIVIERLTQPFGHTYPRDFSHPLRAVVFTTLPMVLAGIWVVGFVAILWGWSVRWRQVADTRRAAKPITQGFEVESLRNLERAAGVSTIPFLLSRSRLEPGIFGIVRPVLLWPEGISGHLQEGQLHSILAHEVWHVRRRDNLVSALQMLIEALFWFHPLVWWLGSRQMEEREQACDEWVLELGNEPTAYAEGILKACKFCVESPLPCVVGVNGSNLKKRIVRIMTYNKTNSLSLARQLALTSLASATFAVPLVVGISSSSTVRAQSATPASSSAVLQVSALKENYSENAMTLVQHTANGTSISNITVKSLIGMAYGLKDYQLSGGPSWIDHTRYDITYTGGDPTMSAQGMVSGTAIKEVLAQRFHLVLRQETKPGPGFALVVGKSGITFTKATPPKAPGTDEPLLQQRVKLDGGIGQISITGAPGGLADTLSQQIGRPIVDKTGLTDIYNIMFHWSTAGESAESISSALEQQLGLELIPQESPVQASVIESIDTPDEI